MKTALTRIPFFIFITFLEGLLFSRIGRANEFPSSSGTSPDIGIEEASTESRDTLDRLLSKYFDSYSLQPSVKTYFVKGDRGRFREDWNVDDRTTGGLEPIAFSTHAGDLQYEYEGRALVDYDYLAHLRVSKEKGYYIDTTWKQFRKFWDGSAGTDPWDPFTYRLTGEFQDWPDAPLHTDRGNVDIELGIPLGDHTTFVTEYHLWTRKGRMPLVRGERAQVGSLDRRGIPMRVRVDGVSNKIVLRLPMTLREIHHFEPSLSYEAYRDSQFTDSARYNNGTIQQRRDYIDQPRFDDLKAQFKYESFLTDDVYVHSGYYFNFLRNDRVRSEVRPTDANPNTYVNPDVDNWRASNVFSVGSALLNFLKQRGLDLRLGFRGEQAVTDSHGTLLAGGTNLRVSDSGLKEGWFGEAASLTYTGIPRTTAYLGLDMEQRTLHYKETYDARSHELVTDFGSTDRFPHYQTQVTYIDFIPKAKLTHRLTSFLKFYAGYRWQRKDRTYDIEEDTNPGAYPGYLVGNEVRQVHDVSAKLDAKLPRGWMSTLKYQLVLDDITFHKVGDDQQDLDRHSYSATLSGPISEKLFAFLTGMYDFYRLDTPTVGVSGNRWGFGQGAYDFNGDVFVVATHLNYVLTEAISVFTTYQITNSLGDNDNTLNEVVIGLRCNLNKTTSFDAGYQVFDFDDDRGFEGYDDDYFGQAMTFALKKALG